MGNIDSGSDDLLGTQRAVRGIPESPSHVASKVYIQSGNLFHRVRCTCIRNIVLL